MNNHNLTTVAALPRAGGCLSALPAEVGKAPNPSLRQDEQGRPYLHFDGGPINRAIPPIGSGAFGDYPLHIGRRHSSGLHEIPGVQMRIVDLSVDESTYAEDALLFAPDGLLSCTNPAPCTSIGLNSPNGEWDIQVAK